MPTHQSQFSNTLRATIQVVVSAPMVVMLSGIGSAASVKRASNRPIPTPEVRTAARISRCSLSGHR